MFSTVNFSLDCGILFHEVDDYSELKNILNNIGNFIENDGKASLEMRQETDLKNERIKKTRPTLEEKNTIKVSLLKQITLWC